jgi:hypothetical protein
MMPGLFISGQGLASVPAVKPAFSDQRVSLLLSNPKPGFFSSCEAPSETDRACATGPPGSGAQRCAQAGEREHHIDSPTGSAATAARSLLSLAAYEGQRCIGFVCSRGKLGFEAFDSEERSLGIYATQREAAAAIMRGKP